MPRSSQGSACLLVLCDSRMSEAQLIDPTIYAALRHFGMPFRMHDLAARPLDRVTLDNCAVAIIAQDNLGLALGDRSLKALLSAVNDGLGLVNFDCHLAGYDAALRDTLGLRGTGRDGAVRSIESKGIGVRTIDHFVTYTQASGATHRFRAAIPATVVRAPQSAAVLAEQVEGEPAVLAFTAGRGRVVQWLVAARVWLSQFFGHAHGLDDLFWKGIVWTARKPFAMLAMPPFVRLRFDDCNGLYRTASDLKFINVLNARGHKPSICICVNALKTSGWGALKRLSDQGKLEVAPHTWMPGMGLFHDNIGGGYTTADFDRLTSATAKMFRKHDIVPSKILSDHDHECNPEALPFLKRLGIEFKMNVMLPGETWSGIHVDWNPRPYGSMSYALDYIPGKYPLFVVFNHFPTFDNVQAYVGQSKFLLNRSGGYGQNMWDFLNGLTTRDNVRNDIEGMANRLAEHTRLGLNSLFFGGSISHSHFTNSLSLNEWRGILDRYERKMSRLEKINVGYDDICLYARSRFHTSLTRASYLPDRKIELTLRGKSESRLQISVFSERDESIERKYVPVEPFDGKRTVIAAG